MNNITKLIVALMSPVQDAENALQQLLTQRSIDTAVGAQLDQIGTIVGQARGGLVDDDYRRYCRARIAANRSTGSVEDAIKIANLVINDITAHHNVDLQGIAAFVLRVEQHVTVESVANALISFLQDAASGGVRPILESCDQPPPTWQRCDLDTFDDATKHMITARDVPR